jgi:predicted transcriptional regulator
MHLILYIISTRVLVKNALGDNDMLMIKNKDESFKDTLLKLIDKKGIADVECYQRASVSRQTWHKILSDIYYHPSKNTVICFALALELDLDETQRLLRTAGYTLMSFLRELKNDFF